MLEIADWISRGKVPVRIKEPLNLTPHVRLNAGGTRGVIVLFNTGLSPIDTATVWIRVPQNIIVRLVSVDKGPAMQRFRDASGWACAFTSCPLGRQSVYCSADTDAAARRNCQPWYARTGRRFQQETRS